MKKKQKKNADAAKRFSATEVLNDNIFAMFGGCVFQPMGTDCAPLLADLFLYSYEADFIQGLPKKNQKNLAASLRPAI